MEDSETPARVTEEVPPEKPAGGSKMLKKAQSFKEDLRNRIRRRPSAGVQQMIADGKGRKSKGDASLSQPGDDDMEKLKMSLAEVNKTLIWIKAVVSKGKIQLLPDSATLILDTVMEIFNLLRYPLQTRESNTLVSSQDKVCQDLAQFIQWTDNSLVATDSTDSSGKPDQGVDIIDSLLKGIQELTKLGMEKMSQRKSSPQTPVAPLQSPSADGAKPSLPDIPLTPREKEFLARNAGGSHSYDNIASFHNKPASPIFSFNLPDVPPPKPPLPANVNILQSRILANQDGEENYDPFNPPPLPDKRRSPNATADILETLSGRNSSATTPTPSPHASSLISSASVDHSLGFGGPRAVSKDMNLLPSGLPDVTDSSSSSSSTILANPSSTNEIISASSSSSSTSSLLSSQFSKQQQNSEGGVITTRSVSRTVSADSKLVSNTMVSRKTTTNKPFDEINELTSQISSLRNSIEDTPPPLPAKKSALNRLNSQYDNVPENLEDRLTAFRELGTTILSSTQQKTVVMRKEVSSRVSSSSTCSTQSSQSNQSQLFSSTANSQRSLQSFLAEERTSSSHETYSSSETFSSTSHSSTESLPKPPPLPPKKKHVQAYMQTFGALTQPGLQDEAISRHSINFYEEKWHQHQRELYYPRSNTISVFSDISSDSSLSSTERLNSLAAPLPLMSKRMSDVSHGSQLSEDSIQSEVSLGDSPGKHPVTESITPAPHISFRQSTASLGLKSEEDKELMTTTPAETQKDTDSCFGEITLLDDVDVSDQIITKKETEDGPEVRGGCIDALIVHATQAGKNEKGSQGNIDSEPKEFMYQEAFLTTYRMFISPKALMEKLLYRFHKFHNGEDSKKKLAHNAFSLLIRVVDELGNNELDSAIIERLVVFIYDLIEEGTFNLARLLRMKVLEKCKRKSQGAKNQTNLPLPIPANVEPAPSSSDFSSFKTHDIAEQMTLLDAQLFQKIEIPEVLMWAREQSEELSPNLTVFTEHFNKMSYWCRTRILLQEDPREREKFFMKFIKIMRHLRKLHNFNSYLAILSALNSAPLTRLEWQRQNVEDLEEFVKLIDCSSSFRVYRQALSETEPPCIPYLGLILQDLTFINIGNQDKLPDGSINFAKHWQQFNILDSMRRFRTSCYQLERNEKILNMLSNFEDHHNEEALWQISQKIKPGTGGHKKQNSIS